MPCTTLSVQVFAKITEGVMFTRATPRWFRRAALAGALAATTALAAIAAPRPADAQY